MAHSADLYNFGKNGYTFLSYLQNITIGEIHFFI